MKHPELMTAILMDGSQVTGVEVHKNLRGDEVTLSCGGHEIPINMHLCISYFKITDPVEFDELTPSETAEIERLTNLSSLLTHQAF